MTKNEAKIKVLKSRLLGTKSVSEKKQILAEIDSIQKNSKRGPVGVKPWEKLSSKPGDKVVLSQRNDEGNKVNVQDSNIELISLDHSSHIL
jgi:hypothetical protein